MPELNDSLVEVERHGVVALLRLNREKQLNALSRPLADQLISRLGELERDREVRSVVLAGSGRAFSSGGDLVDIGAGVEDGAEWSRLDLLRRLQAMTRAIRDSRLPVVASVHGAAYGAGWSLALACDLIVATKDTRFCQVFVKRDLVPDLGSAWVLPRVIGELRAKELMLLGEEISAQTAHEYGLVNRLVGDQTEAEAEALDLAERIAGVSVATLAMTKSMINRGQTMGYEEFLVLEEHSQAVGLGADSAVEAMAAFTKKKK